MVSSEPRRLLYDYKRKIYFCSEKTFRIIFVEDENSEVLLYDLLTKEVSVFLAFSQICR